MGSGSLSHILLGAGLGILAISGFIVTGLFGQYHNKSRNDFTKFFSKVSKTKDDSIRSCCLAIAVLGCLSAIAAIAAIVLSILLEGQTMILIIVGAVSAIFAFGCIVAEGVYTKKNVDYYDKSTVEQNKRDHAEEIEHISKSIDLLLEIGRKSIMMKYEKDSNDRPINWENQLSTTNEVLGLLGKSIYKEPKNQYRQDVIFTYKYIWQPSYISFDSYNDLQLKDFVVLFQKDNLIYATTYQEYMKNRLYSDIYNYYRLQYRVEVASLSFDSDAKKCKPKQQVCWPTDVKNLTTFKEFECTMIDLQETTLNKTYDFTSGYDNYALYGSYGTYSLNEKVVVGNYIKPNDASDRNVDVDYEVSDFPIMFHTISTSELQNYIENEEEEGFHYSDSVNQHILTGKDYANLMSKLDIDIFKKGDKEKAIVTLEKVDSYDSLVRVCGSYFNDVSKDPKKRQSNVCYFGGNSIYDQEDFIDELEYSLKSGQFSSLGISTYSIWNAMNSHYDGYNEGKIDPKYEDYIKKDNSKYIKDYPKTSSFSRALYTTALIHLIVQIIGIVFWAIGRFIGLALGGSDAKTQSEGEA